MASFEQHVNIALIATGIVIIPLHTSALLDVKESIAVLALGVVGGVLPDLDSDNSKPIQIVFKMLSIFMPLFILLFSPINIPVLYALAIWIGSALFLHFTLFRTFLLITTHRGVFHTVPMGILFGQATTLVFLKLLHKSLDFSLLAGFFIFFGFSIHLLLDEIFSINALGMHIKKSLGSALKFYDRDNIAGTLLLYALIIVSFFFIPIDKDLYLQIFYAFEQIKLI